MTPSSPPPSRYLCHTHVRAFRHRDRAYGGKPCWDDVVRALIPQPPAADVDVHGWYADGWLDRGGLRVNFIASIDGAVSVAGLSGGLQTPGDNVVFAALRDLADVVVVGAGTARAEGYGPSRPSEERRRQRREAGFADTLPIAIVSRSLHLDPSASLFVETVSDVRTIVVTCDAADPGLRRVLAAVADIIVCGDSDVDLSAARRAFEERGHTRILCEGGPRLFGDFARAGVMDELCLTVSPLLAGPGPGRIITGDTWDTPHPMRLRGMLEEDGALFCRYVRADVETGATVHVVS